MDIYININLYMYMAYMVLCTSDSKLHRGKFKRNFGPRTPPRAQQKIATELKVESRKVNGKGEGRLEEDNKVKKRESGGIINKQRYLSSQANGITGLWL
jgi:hypothetical protein